ncbi:MAG: TMEM43 family protein [Oligoflexales bacterium]
MSESYESRNNPLSGLITGLILCVSCTYAFWLNENRFDYGKAAAKTRPIKSFKKASLEPLENKNVSLSQKIKTKEKVKDPIFFSEEQEFFTLSRNVQVYAWVEKKRDNSTYYEKEWTSNPERIRENKDPKWPYFYTQIKNFRLGRMHINTKYLEFSYPERTIFSKDYFSLQWQENLNQNSRYFYPVGQNIGSPQLNDHRLEFEVRDPITKGTLFGKLKNGSIVPYFGPNKNSGGAFKKMLKTFIIELSNFLTS